MVDQHQQDGRELPYLSVVAPCYNEQEVLPELYDRVSKVCRKLNKSYEIVLVNDGSKDTTWSMLRDLAARDSHVVAVNLARNHGHQLALSAGLSICLGQRVLVLDADLQDPPELLPEMLAVMDQGVDVVYGQRRTRYGDSLPKRIACAVFYRTLRQLSDHPIPLDSGDFRLISRRALDILVSMPERHRFLRGMVSWIGFRQEPFLYDRDPRFAGETKYPLRKLIELAVNGVTAFSTKPLRLAIHFGLLSIMFALLLFVYSIVSWFIFPDAPKGWASLMGAVSILGGIQLLVLGVLGEYLGRLYEQAKGRPLFIVDRIYRSQTDGSPAPEMDRATAPSSSLMNGGYVANKTA
ncbi:MAG: glycosyltransferase family 2 protein [Pirellulales bacterium]